MSTVYSYFVTGNYTFFKGWSLGRVVKKKFVLAGGHEICYNIKSVASGHECRTPRWKRDEGD
ncbi:MAG: hypothetical protein J5819_09660 [Eubacterium sp.]|nr:hypothetical protein [Eubacterium sp.]